MSWVFSIIGIIGIISFALLLIPGIIFLVISYLEKSDIGKKKKLKKLGLFFILIPVGLVIFSMIGAVVVSVMSYAG